MDYGFSHAGKVFTPNGTTGVSATENDARNKAIEAAELAHWNTKPDSILAYYNFPDSHTAPNVSTWLGTVIGWIGDYRIYRHNFGSRMVSMRVRGTNGAIYHGRASYDNGNVINLRRHVSRLAKEQV